MKDVDYRGSITEDIALTNDTDEYLRDIKKSKKINIALLICGGVISALLSVKFGYNIFTSFVAAFVGAGFAVNTLRIRAKEAVRKVKKQNAEANLQNLTYSLNNEKTNSKMLASSVSVDNLKNSVVVMTGGGEIPDMDDDLEEVSEQDIEEYANIIIRDIYFYDIHSSIKALREFKKIANFRSKKDSYVKSVKVQQLEPNDFPKELPVKQVLRLTNNEVSHERR
ncbi:MAG: hypothetical protein J1F35_07095 [Erysipelotrichales bacterium]|nr:hypothetical protein [Erysipelotrichales bacterium]